ncbi:hypothetical protein FGO68_gene11344 [Halteria grandinella]|uniref:Uncharacterized protein n=1 Tax=Halteria grandinella TaxID=5974 RepID=A0A8J8NYC6_HALGN|nr:hypothetical protein FGO68_gene11344 [Halteria grandinella]
MNYTFLSISIEIIKSIFNSLKAFKFSIAQFDTLFTTSMQNEVLAISQQQNFKVFNQFNLCSISIMPSITPSQHSRGNSSILILTNSPNFYNNSKQL